VYSPEAPAKLPSPKKRAAAIQAKTEFTRWREKWDALGRFDGPVLKDPDKRISEILALWQVEIPGAWKRSVKDLPTRLASEQRYVRGNGESKCRGEHRIEYEILVDHFDTATYNGRILLDGVNAFPLVKSESGRRNDNIEPDLVILVGPENAASILVLDVKKTDGNAWSALVQNLRQFRLFLLNPACASFFDQRKNEVNVVQKSAGVIAPTEFYTSKHKKKSSVPHARRLIDAMRKTHNIYAELLVWDADSKTAVSAFDTDLL
jgi:hypothetical protein